jgi:ABC-2 type transport system ATP-binding protein
MEPKKMIKTQDLTKDYGTTIAVNKLNLNIAAGEIYGFIGPNGAGKTTTIRMMGGILDPTTGKVIIGGYDMNKDPVTAKKMIGFVPDRPFLYEKLTGMEFLRFSADLYGVGSSVFGQKAEQLLRQFALWDWADEIIEAYSHGMKQRLIIAAALLHDPQILIIDEPMVGLDPAAVHMVKGIFRQLASEKITVFISTHTLSIAEDLCHRIGVIHKGMLLAQGTVGELRHIARLGEAGLEEVFLTIIKEDTFL